MKRSPVSSSVLLFALAVLGGGALGGCAAGRPPYALAPVKTFDPDNRSIPEPRELEENRYWDPVDMTFLYQLQKPLDLNWSLRKVGRALGLVGPLEAHNVNALDEVPNSSWFTQRHFYQPMTLEELQRGVGDAGPDLSGPLTVVAGKNEGRTKGFTVEDVTGARFLIKFDGPEYPELSSSSEVIATVVYHAAGYHVPENTVVYFDPATLVLDPEADIDEAGRERLMTPADVEAILGPQPRRAGDGHVRALASRYVPGRPYGIWEFRGRRPDDPNDLVLHEHRRELRGLSVLGSWLNDGDRRNANTLAVYMTEPQPDGDTLRYLRHYLADMGSTLGSNGAGVHSPNHGNQYLIDPRWIASRTVTLGAGGQPWEAEPMQSFYPAVGYFEAEYFHPERWRMVYPNAAYERRTALDGFWGAKRVMAFTEPEVRALVAAGQITDPEAEEYLVRTLMLRREKIGRYWFGRVNPLDRFAVQPSASGLVLAFDDLAVTYGLERDETSRYVYRVTAVGSSAPLAEYTVESPSISLPAVPPGAREPVLAVEIRTLRDGGRPSPRATVYVHLPPGGAPRLVGLDRES